ncbi:predicted GPI-anchored protein 58 [Oryza brachyantha]|uniref:predicted GPI-anchored protein 58 n=1 Tax=Oryza brachyantha TaxID=4533 RepID=UPI001AD9B4F8|nr:predicted GPI-anchored protein 58 [Oryza brachyantha]
MASASSSPDTPYEIPESPVSPAANVTPALSAVVDPAPATVTAPVPASLASPSSPSLRFGMKRKMLPYAPSSPTLPADTDPTPVPVPEEVLLPANTPIQLADVASVAQSATPAISAKITGLQSRKAALEAELVQVMADLVAEENKLANLPSVVVAQEQTLKSAVQAAIHSRRSLKAIAGTDADDLKIIQGADNVRLRAIAALKVYLGL